MELLQGRRESLGTKLYSCVIVNRFRAALDFDTYPLSNVIHPRCAERAKQSESDRGKPVLIELHNGFFASFDAISQTQSFQFFHAFIALKLLVSLISRLVGCNTRIVVE